MTEAEPRCELEASVSTLGPEPDLGLTAEAIENGAEPDDALYIDRGWLPAPPEVADELDTAYGAAQARRQLAEALAAAREAEAEADAALDELEPDPEPEIG
jgi:regulator of protease activity HflC (stomatin/prohibitin superfamily)